MTERSRIIHNWIETMKCFTGDEELPYKSVDRLCERIEDLSYDECRHTEQKYEQEIRRLNLEIQGLKHQIQVLRGFTGLPQNPKRVVVFEQHDFGDWVEKERVGFIQPRHEFYYPRHRRFRRTDVPEVPQ